MNTVFTLNGSSNMGGLCDDEQTLASVLLEGGSLVSFYSRYRPRFVDADCGVTMIVSKANLLTVKVVKNDRAIPVLNNVHFAVDGSTVGCNGQAVLAVGPVPEQTKEDIPLEQTQGNARDDEERFPAVTVSAESVGEVLKGIPRDTMFGGLLEFCDVSAGEDGVTFEWTDGKRKKRVEGKRWPRKYTNYQDVLKRVYNTRLTGKVHRVVLNLKRFMAILETLEKACPDSTGQAPVWIEFSEANDIMIRTVNQKTGQRAVAVMSSYKGIEGEWLGEDEWERSFYKSKPKKGSKPCRKITKSKKNVSGQQPKKFQKHCRPLRKPAKRAKKIRK